MVFSERSAASQWQDLQSRVILHVDQLIWPPGEPYRRPLSTQVCRANLLNLVRFNDPYSVVSSCFSPVNLPTFGARRR